MLKVKTFSTMYPEGDYGCKYGHQVLLVRHIKPYGSYLQIVSLVTLQCIYFSISQKQEEGNISWKTIGVNRTRQVFKNRCPLFWDSCDLEKDRMDIKEVVGKDSNI